MKGCDFVKTFLFSGVHGVGKGFFLNRVKSEIENYTLLSASDLIGKYKSAADAGYKKVAQVNKNQDVLINALNQEQCCSSQDIILDGHICIFNSDGLIESIPKFFFIDGKIDGIIILQDSVEEIYNRIRLRDSKTINIEDITNMQNKEKEYAVALEKEFSIKYRVISHECSAEQFEMILEELGGDSFE